MSGVLLKTGIYGLLRTAGLFEAPPASWGVVLMVLGAASGVLGVALALAQHDLKRLLAYHSVENIGIITMGVGLAMLGRARGEPALVLLGFAGGALHVVNHALFKSLLFLGAGSVQHATGTRDIEHLGGLARAMPWTAGLFLVGAAAISGLPPLNGFVSEWFVALGAVRVLDLPPPRPGLLRGAGGSGAGAGGGAGGGLLREGPGNGVPGQPAECGGGGSPRVAPRHAGPDGGAGGGVRGHRRGAGLARRAAGPRGRGLVGDAARRAGRAGGGGGGGGGLGVGGGGRAPRGGVRAVAPAAPARRRHRRGGRDLGHAATPVPPRAWPTPAAPSRRS